MRGVLGAMLAAAVACPAAAQEGLTQADLLRRLIDLDRLTAPPPAGEQAVLFSSYDRRSRIDEAGRAVAWDANEDCGHFLRRDEDGWCVMAEVDGPGAITRVWASDARGPLRIILDGAVVVDATFETFLSGKLSPLEPPLVSPGMSCHYPIGFSQSCIVACRDTRACYQVDCVRLAAGTRVERFRLEPDEAARTAFDDVATALLPPPLTEPLLPKRRLMPVAVHERLGPGDVLREALKGAGTVRALYVALTDRVDPRELYAMHRFVLRIYFDGQDDPAVECPLCEFFGRGFELGPLESFVAGTSKQLLLPLPDRRASQASFMYCYFPMPYRHGLKIEIANENEQRQQIGLLVFLRIDTRSPARDAFRFHARYRKADPCREFEYAVLEALGPGRVVGSVLNVDCPSVACWAEGDHKVWIDDEPFPSHYGTGVAGCFGVARPPAVHEGPLQGVTRADATGKKSAYRWRVSDCISYQRSVWFTVENWQQGKPEGAYYGSVAYWYATPGAAHFFGRLGAEDLALPGLRIPGAVEIEDRVSGADWGVIVKQKYTYGVELSGGMAARITSDQPVRISISSDSARVVRLKLRTDPRRPFGTIRVADADGAPIGTVVYEREAGGLYTVGRLRLKPGENVVVVQCDRPATLDCWVLDELGQGDGIPAVRD